MKSNLSRISLLVLSLSVITPLTLFAQEATPLETLYQIIENRVESDILQDQLVVVILERLDLSPSFKTSDSIQKTQLILNDIYNVNLPNFGERQLVVNKLKSGSADDRQAVKGDVLTVDYVGLLSDGTTFDNSFEIKRTPFQFELGKQTVIKGWEEGLVGVRTGDMVQLNFGSELGYGAGGAGEIIPANSPLSFIIKVREVESTEISLVNESRSSTLVNGPSDLVVDFPTDMPVEYNSTTESFSVYYEDAGVLELITTYQSSRSIDDIVATYNNYLAGNGYRVVENRLDSGSLVQVRGINNSQVASVLAESMSNGVVEVNVSYSESVNVIK